MYANMKIELTRLLPRAECHTWAKEKSSVMLQSMPSFCSRSQALMPSHVDASLMYSLHT